MTKKEYIKKIWLQRAMAAGMLALSTLGIIIEGNATFTVLAAFICIPMFLSKKLWIG